MSISREKRIPSANDLRTTHPELLKEWNIETPRSKAGFFIAHARNRHDQRRDDVSSGSDGFGTTGGAMARWHGNRRPRDNWGGDAPAVGPPDLEQQTTAGSDGARPLGCWLGSNPAQSGSVATGCHAPLRLSRFCHATSEH